MKIGVVSDIHSNLPALEAALADMGTVDALWCLGDFVGYGPWPNECIDLLRARGAVAIAGNHDLAATGAIPTYNFNSQAAEAAEWTGRHLRSDCAAYLKSLSAVTEVEPLRTPQPSGEPTLAQAPSRPLTGQPTPRGWSSTGHPTGSRASPPAAPSRGVTLAHGSPREPVWEYVLSPQVAAASFECFSTHVCFVGHTHIPSVFQLEGVRQVRIAHMQAGASHSVGPERLIVNPGSVGQPRDRDPRAAYAIYDTDRATIEWQRTAYDIGLAQRRIREAGLPVVFAERLSYGV